MCDQASRCSGIKEQEGGGIQDWFRNRNRRSSDGRRLPRGSQTGHNRFKMTVSGVGAALNRFDYVTTQNSMTRYTRRSRSGEAGCFIERPLSGV
jgi:hypothetical protein